MHQDSDPLAQCLMPSWALKNKAACQGESHKAKSTVRSADFGPSSAAGHSRAATETCARTTAHSNQVSGPRSSYYNSSSRENRQLGSWKQSVQGGASFRAVTLPGSDNFGQSKAYHSTASLAAGTDQSWSIGDKRQASGNNTAWCYPGISSSNNNKPIASALADTQCKPLSGVSPASSPISPTLTPSNKQVAYKKGAFGQDFPSLPSTQELCYAPKEAPYREPFLLSRATGTWTSRLVDAPPTGAQDHGKGMPGSPADTAPDGRGGSTAQGRQALLQATPEPAGGASAAAAAVAGGQAAATHGRESFAQAAGTAAAMAGGPGDSAGSCLSDDQLREQLAVKQLKQLIPVMARKDDSGSAPGLGRGRQHSIQGASRPGQVPAGLQQLKMFGLAGPGTKAVLGGSGMVALTKKKAATAAAQGPLPPSVRPPAAAVAAAAQEPLLLRKLPRVAQVAPKPILCVQGPADTQETSAEDQQQQQQQQPIPEAAAGLQQVLPAEEHVVAGSEAEAPLLQQDDAGSQQPLLRPATSLYTDGPLLGITSGFVTCLSHRDLSDQQQQQQSSRKQELAELSRFLPGDLLDAEPDQDQEQQQQQQQLEEELPGHLPAGLLGSLGPEAQQQRTCFAGLQSELLSQQQQQQQQQQHLALSEEEAFLRSLGWSEEDSADDELTEEEIAAFKAAELGRSGSAPPYTPQPPYCHLYGQLYGQHSGTLTMPGALGFPTVGLAGIKGMSLGEENCLLGYDLVAGARPFAASPVALRSLQGQLKAASLQVPTAGAAKRGEACAASIASDNSMTDSEDL